MSSVGAVVDGRVDVVEESSAAVRVDGAAAADVDGKATGGRDHGGLRLPSCQNRCLAATGNCHMGGRCREAAGTCPTTETKRNHY